MNVFLYLLLFKMFEFKVFARRVQKNLFFFSISFSRYQFKSQEKKRRHYSQNWTHLIQHCSRLNPRTVSFFCFWSKREKKESIYIRRQNCIRLTQRCHSRRPGSPFSPFHSSTKNPLFRLPHPWLPHFTYGALFASSRITCREKKYIYIYENIARIPCQSRNPKAKTAIISSFGECLPESGCR